MGIVNCLKSIARTPSLLKTLCFGAIIMPSHPGRVMIDDTAQGLRLLHTADTSMEAGWLQQILSEAGFHMEYVPSPTTGMFGIMANNSIYVREQEYDEASQFLDDYMKSPPDETA